MANHIVIIKSLLQLKFSSSAATDTSSLQDSSPSPPTGAAYGDGVYFAKDASYSKGYSQPSSHGECCMYLARVLVGKYTAGKKGMKTPPAIDPSKPEILFDSVVNKMDDPMIFVIFNDFHVYPEYLITFKNE